MRRRKQDRERREMLQGYDFTQPAFEFRGLLEKFDWQSEEKQRLKGLSRSAFTDGDDSTVDD